ncbi:MAG: enoyl-CoA hydratase [bacterium]|nr:enoyl-CoA hydratase [Gammaproteobacteria bacterium]HIL97200.1 enoyl-CoA hydratase [Pseudomonadales bacterium]
MTEPVLLVDKRDGIAILTLNRPRQLNALSLELRYALQEEIIKLRSDREIGVVILTGAGRAFCAGLDLKEMGSADVPKAHSELLDPPQLLRTLPQPVIGAINGLAVTGGLEISLSCDLLIVTPETKFADTHTRIGLIAGWGLSQRLSRAIGINRAKELSLTGNYLSAELAYEWGLANRIVPREELLPTCISLARDMLSAVPEVMFKTKRLIDRGFDLALGDAMTYEVEINQLHKGPRPEEVAARLAGVQTRGRNQAENE